MMSTLPGASGSDLRDSEQSAGTFASAPNRSVKRKLQDVFRSLDEALTPNPKSTLKRPRTSRSVYSALTNYGIDSRASQELISEQPITDPETLSQTPHLTAILSRSAARARKTVPTHPAVLSHSEANLTSSPSFADYKPWSTERFIERLGTFKLNTYSSKPNEIDAVTAAKCGWVNEGKDRLVCGMCHASWVVAATQRMSTAAASALAEKQRTSMVEMHKDGCPWKNRQCDDAVYRVPLQAPLVMAKEIKSHALTLDPLVRDIHIKHPLTSSEVQSIKNIISSVTARSTLALLNDSDDSSASAPLDTGSTVDQHEPEPTPSETAILIVLFGWAVAPPTPPPPRYPAVSSASMSASRAPSVFASRGNSVSISRATSVAPSRSPSVSRASSLAPDENERSSSPASRNENLNLKPETAMLACSLCHRRVGIWSFIHSREEATNQSVQDSSSAAPSSSPIPSPRPPSKQLDLLREHRNYCPYVVRSSVVPAPPDSLSPSTLYRPEGNENVPIEGWKAALEVVLRHGSKRRTNAHLEGQSAEGDRSSEPVDEVNAMIEDVKLDGGRELLRYVRGLLG